MSNDKRPFDKPLVACIIAGAIVGLMCTTFASIQYSTPGPIPPPGDTVTEVTSTFSIFGIAVRESTGPWANHSQRYNDFHRIVALLFTIVGMLLGLVVYFAAFQRRSSAVTLKE
jgi:drug/metabolite transporter (DMT)-like permease